MAVSIGFAQFAKRIRRRGDNVEKNSVRAVRKVATRTLIGVAMGTPQNTGKSVSNWRVGLSRPTSAVIGAYAPGKNLGKGNLANAGPVIAAGKAQIARLRTMSGARSVHITNSYRSIPFLRSGHSAQQSGDWVSVAVNSARSELRGVRFLETPGPG